MVEDGVEEVVCEAEGCVQEGFVLGEENEEPATAGVEEGWAVEGIEEREDIVEVEHGGVEFAVEDAPGGFVGIEVARGGTGGSWEGGGRLGLGLGSGGLLLGLLLGSGGLLLLGWLGGG